MSLIQIVLLLVKDKLGESIHSRWAIVYHILKIFQGGEWKFFHYFFPRPLEIKRIPLYNSNDVENDPSIISSGIYGNRQKNPFIIGTYDTSDYTISGLA